LYHNNKDINSKKKYKRAFLDIEWIIQSKLRPPQVKDYLIYLKHLRMVCNSCKAKVLFHLFNSFFHYEQPNNLEKMKKAIARRQACEERKANLPEVSFLIAFVILLNDSLSNSSLLL
jgi:hypothetical protein